jgi:hypothetical protein
MTAVGLGDRNNPAVSRSFDRAIQYACVVERPKTKLVGNAQIVPRQGNIIAGAGSLTRFLR